MKKLAITPWVLLAFIFASAPAQENDPNQKTAAPVPAQAIEFAGYTIIASERFFVLLDTRRNESSPWTKLGQAWRGYVLTSFDPKTEKLTVKMAQAEFVLPLQRSKVQATTDPALVGRWHSFELGGFNSGGIESLTFRFTGDGRFTVSAMAKDRPPETSEGRYVVQGSVIEMTINGRGSEKETYSLEDGVLTIRDMKDDSYGKFRKNP